VLSKKTVTAVFAKNEMTAFYGSLCYYLTRMQSKKAVFALQTGINHNTNRPYLQNSYAISAKKAVITGTGMCQVKRLYLHNGHLANLQIGLFGSSVSRHTGTRSYLLRHNWRRHVQRAAIAKIRYRKSPRDTMSCRTVKLKLTQP